MPEIKKAYVTLMVDDLDRSVDFYTNILGLVEDLRFGDNWAEMVTKGITIGLHPKKVGAPPELSAKMAWGSVEGKHPGGGAQPNNGASASSGAAAGHNQGERPGLRAGAQVHVPHGPSIGFEVKDIRATAKEMEAKGVRFHFQENEVNILAFFFDPDGTPLYLTQVR